MSAGSSLGTIFTVLALRTVRSTCNGSNDPRAHRLLLQDNNLRDVARRAVTSRFPSGFADERRCVLAVMRVPGDPLPTYRDDKTEQHRVRRQPSPDCLESSIDAFRFSIRFLSICLWFAPDGLMLLTTVIAFVLLRKLTLAPPVDAEEAEGAAKEDVDEVSYSAQSYVLLKRVAVFLSMATLLFAATLRPSIPSAIYFIVFLFAGNVCAIYKEIGRKFAIVCRLLLLVLSVHIFALLAYQTPYPQEIFDVNSTIIRCV